jgi:hypothetical protein
VNSMLRTGLVVAVVVLTFVPAIRGADFEWVFEPIDAVEVTNPPIPNVDVQLIVDDDSVEGDFGVGGPVAQQFLWFNRFSPSLSNPIRLNEIWVLFPAGPNMTVGADVQLVVYHDPDGDPSNGADFVASFSETTQFVDGATFSVYSLATPLVFDEPGDILIGVVNRFVVSGVTTSTRPAAMDTTASQGRSWVAVWSADPADPPVLPADNIYQTIDGFVPGNWMIRAFGDQLQTPAIPIHTNLGLGVLLSMLALAGVMLIRRSI